MKSSNDPIGNRNHGFEACGAVPQTNAPPRAAKNFLASLKILCFLRNQTFVNVSTRALTFPYPKPV